MKERASLRTIDGEPEAAPVSREIAMMSGVGEVITVRAAKTHLSGLLDLVASGREIVITSDGKPKVKIVPMGHGAPRKVFTGTWEHLAKMPKWNGGPTADDLIREDRDARG